MIINNFHVTGSITLHDIYTAMPWSNTIDVVTIRGDTLKSVLEHSVSKYNINDPDPGGRFLQVSGLILKYDVRRAPGQRLLSAETSSDHSPIKDDLVYKVAVPSFLATGGDTFAMIPEQLIEYKNTGFLDNDLIVAYLKKHNPLQLPKAGRMVVLSDNTNPTTMVIASRGAIAWSPLALTDALMLWITMYNLIVATLV